MLWWELLYFVLYYNDMYMFSEHLRVFTTTCTCSVNTIACIYNDILTCMVVYI